MADELAQINVGRLVAPVGDPLVAEFVDALDRINALADASPGFRWRFQTEEGNATSVRPFDDDRIAVNMSVWATLDDLSAYVYRSDHTAFLRRRREWFEPSTSPATALWWVPAGHRPTIEEGIERLERLRIEGPTPAAFTFHQRFTDSGDGPMGRAPTTEP